MTSSEHLDDQIRDKILANGGDINITDYPYLITEARELGLTQTDLARRIGNIFNTIDWLPYRRIDKLLEPFLEKGIILEKDANEIITSLENNLARPVVVNYILVTLKSRDFLAREKNSFEADSFKNIWATEDGYQKYLRNLIEVEWLDEKAHSLAELGSIMYRKPDDAKYFLRNTNYLVPHVTTLTKSPSQADEFSKIIENEPNPDKRYVKVMYRLNRSLPLRLLGEDFANIHSLFEKTATDYTLFKAASERYVDGFIHIWLTETDPINSDKLTSDCDYNSFLTFLYKINNQHPFYLFTKRFNTPEQLVQTAATEAPLWTQIAASAANSQLQIWLAGIGRQQWLSLLIEKEKTIQSSPFYSDEEKLLATTQALMQIVDADMQPPHIATNPKQIQLLSIEGSKTITHLLQLQLQNTGFTKAHVFIEKQPGGISFNENSFVFWSVGGFVTHTLYITVEALQLVKNKVYDMNILIETEFENISVPFQIKVIFPKKAFIKEIALYGSISFIFFASVRLLLSTQYPDWLSHSFKYFASWDSIKYSGELAIFGWLMLLLIVSIFIGIYFLIKYLKKK